MTRGEPGVAAERVLLGLGANLGDPAAQLRAAVERLRPSVSALRLSPVYRTAPVGHADQPDFLNLVCSGTTALGPEPLLRLAQAIEKELGRERPFPNAPRRIDIDILAYGERVAVLPGLVLPHPRLHLRAFVLAPLAALEPAWEHPVLRRSAAELLARLASPERVECLGPIDEI